MLILSPQILSYGGKKNYASGGLLMPKVLDNVQIGPQNWKMRVLAPKLVDKARAGQFVIVRVNEAGERVPMSIGGLDKENGVLTIIYQVVGKTSGLMTTVPAAGRYPRLCRAARPANPCRKLGHGGSGRRRHRYRADLSDRPGLEGGRQQDLYHYRRPLQEHPLLRGGAQRRRRSVIRLYR